MNTLDYYIQTVKSQEKMHLKNRLLKSSAANNCLTLQTNISIEANSVDPDQSSLIWVRNVCDRGFLNISADEKADDFCCGWRFKG